MDNLYIELAPLENIVAVHVQTAYDVPVNCNFLIFNAALADQQAKEEEKNENEDD